MEAEKICPVCLDEYELVDFDVDGVSLEHRGVFRCGCEEITIFPEFMTLDIIEDLDLKERLRLSRLHHLGKTVEESRGLISPRARLALKAGSRRLQRYIEQVSEQSIRSLARR